MGSITHPAGIRFALFGLLTLVVPESGYFLGITFRHMCAAELKIHS
jgi:hypothetical protein